MSESILERVQADTRTAMKAGERERVTTLRMIASSLQQDAKLGDDDAVAVLQRERKKRVEAAEAFGAAGRVEQAEAERAEAKLITGYLPEQISDDELDALVADWVAARDADEVERRFAEAAIPGIRVLSMAEIFADPHYAAREALLQVPDAELGTVAMAAPVPRLSETPGRIEHTGPPLGRDTDLLLAELGYGDDEIARLREAGVA